MSKPKLTDIEIRFCKKLYMYYGRKFHHDWRMDWNRNFINFLVSIFMIIQNILNLLVFTWVTNLPISFWKKLWEIFMSKPKTLHPSAIKFWKKIYMLQGMDYRVYAYVIGQDLMDEYWEISGDDFYFKFFDGHTQTLYKLGYSTSNTLKGSFTQKFIDEIINGN